MANKDTEDKIIVLSKTFNSEEERRSYFREELGKKLPELKKIAGFPIGEDEDILNLSDPPFYTACPNPWLNDFIAEWEVEKKDLEIHGKRVADFEVNEPYAVDVSEGKNNPVYKAHSYHTKVPHPAIMRYLFHYTQPGDSVLDSFAGTGMTGVAAKLMDGRDPALKLSLDPFRKLSWGKRFSINIDLSPSATFIARNFNRPNSPIFFNKSKAIIKTLEKELGWAYKTKHTNGALCDIIYTAWSEVLICNNCGGSNNFFESAVDEKTGAVSEIVKCQLCSFEAEKRNFQKSYTVKYDPILGEPVSVRNYQPSLISYKFGSKNYRKKPDAYDLEILSRISSELKEIQIKSFEVPKGDKTQEALSSKVLYSHQFYFERQLLLLAKIANKLDETSNYINISSIANVASRLYRLTSQGGSFGAGGGPMNGVIYFPSLVKELSVIKLFYEHVKKTEKLSIYLQGDFNIVGTQSATDLLNILDNSIDYIFTDPPFGANLMYSELNFLRESWLKVLTNNKEEAIENKTQRKSTLIYQGLMIACFKEYYRVLKPGKWMTVEFSNTSAAVWNGIQTAIQSSGFILSNVISLDKKQGSYNAVNNPTSVKQDLVISCYKPSSEFDQKFNQNKQSDVGVWEFVDEHLEHLPIHLVSGNSTIAIIERSPKILYDRLIAFYLQRSLPVPIDAREFQQGLRERFIERDGMFFTNEQVQEYDNKKAAVPNFTQLSIFVANEEDSIYWLRRLLENNRKTESELHPVWMKEVAGNMRKGDALPEMRTILEENFLKDEIGKWYVPDSENEADLEKLRNKRLLKQFDLYKIEAVNPRSKIKECRVEALRAGFKQCYQDKDFRTIVTIGDSIPNNLLMEDEVLLQFYDIANSRI